jgi:hypothetical protein
MSLGDAVAEPKSTTHVAKRDAKILATLWTDENYCANRQCESAFFGNQLIPVGSTGPKSLEKGWLSRFATCAMLNMWEGVLETRSDRQLIGRRRGLILEARRGGLSGDQAKG